MLTPEQEQRFRAHLRALNARETCLICDTDRWAYALIGSDHENALIHRTCERCGATQLFNPRPLGFALGRQTLPSGWTVHVLVIRTENISVAEDVQRSRALLMG